MSSEHRQVPRKTIYVSPKSIRERFNTSQYPSWIAQGLLKAETVRDTVLKDPPPGKGPPGTRSQFIRYFDQSRQWVVEIHQYVRPDGTLGGSGKPDPKRLVIGNTIYAVS
jgi:hypothetical protein